MTIAQIREIDDKLAQIATGVNLQVGDAMKGTPIEKTSHVMTCLITSLASLKAGVLDLAETRNLYGVYVLFRAFLEHMLRTEAIMVKALTDRSDDFAEKYLQLRISEEFAYLSACKEAQLDIGGNAKFIIDGRFPEARKLSCKEIRQLGDPFKYKRLIQTIRTFARIDAPDFTSKIIPNYSKLSGFVHGGPFARAVLASFPTEDSITDELCLVADLTVSMFFSVQRYLLMLASSFRPELFEQHFARLDEAINTLHKAERTERPTSESSEKSLDSEV